jgi:hypothetical protein
MGGVVIDEIPKHAVDVLNGHDAVVRLQAAFDHPAGARADQVARGMQRHLRNALAVEHEVESIDQIGRGIHQRAVEIEYNNAGRGHAKIAIGPGAIVQALRPSLPKSPLYGCSFRQNDARYAPQTPASRRPIA